MALMLGKLYDALRHAEVPEREAREAAEEVATYESRLSAIDLKLGKLDAEIGPIKWMLGFNVVMTVAILMRTFFA